MPYTDQEIRQGLSSMGYDTNKVTARELPSGDLQIMPITQAQPSSMAGMQQPGFGGNQTTAMGAFGHAAALNALPAAIGGVSAGIGVALAPETGGLSMLIPILAGIAGAYGGSKLQQAGLQAALPADKLQAMQQQLGQEQQQHPLAALGGAGIANLLGGLSPSVGNVLSAGRTTGRLIGNQILPAGAETVSRAEMGNLANVGLGAGLQGGLAAGGQLMGGQGINPTDILQQMAIGALFNKPNALGVNQYGFHPQAAGPVIPPDARVGAEGNNRLTKAQIAAMSAPTTAQQTSGLAEQYGPVSSGAPSDLAKLTRAMDAMQIGGSATLAQHQQSISDLANIAQQAMKQLDYVKMQQEAQQQQMAEILQSVKAPTTAAPSAYGNPITENQANLIRPSLQDIVRANQIPPVEARPTEVTPPEEQRYMGAPPPTPAEQEDNVTQADIDRQIYGAKYQPANRPKSLSDQDYVRPAEGQSWEDALTAANAEARYPLTNSKGERIKAVDLSSTLSLMSQFARSEYLRLMNKQNTAMGYAEHLDNTQHPSFPAVEQALNTKPNSAVEFEAKLNAIIDRSQGSGGPVRNQPVQEPDKSPGFVGWATNLFNKMGLERNIKYDLHNGTMQTEEGQPVNGRAYLRQGLGDAVAKVNVNNLDTFMHESGHIFLDDLLHSDNPKDQLTVKNILDNTEKSQDYKDFNAKLVARGEKPISPEEYFQQYQGEAFARDSKNYKPSLAQDLVSRIKANWGNPSMDDVSRLFQNKFFRDPSFLETHAKLLPTVATTEGEVKNQLAPEDHAEYTRLQAEMSALRPEQPDFDARFQDVMSRMEAIKNQNKGYAPGTEPLNQPSNRERALGPTGIRPLDEGFKKVQDKFDEAGDQTGIAYENLKRVAEKYGYDSVEYQHAEAEHNRSMNDTRDAMHDYLGMAKQVNVNKAQIALNQPADRESVLGKTFPITRAAIDRERLEVGDKIADAHTRLYNTQQDYLGRLRNPGMQSILAGSPADRAKVLDVLQRERDTQEDHSGMLSNQKQQNMYRTLRDKLAEQFDIRTENGQPVITSNNHYRKAKQDPYFMPSIMDKKVADVLRQGTDREAIEKYHQDWLDHMDKMDVKPEKAEEQWQELNSVLRGDLGNPTTASRNQAYFNGIRKQEGISLPESMREPDLARTWDSYTRRSAADMAHYKEIESHPDIAALHGYTKDGWGNPIEPDVKAANESLMGNTTVKNIMEHYRGATTDQFEQKARAFESGATISILGPLTEIHKSFSTIAQSLGFARPEEVGGIVKGLTSYHDGWQKALDMGQAQMPKRTFQDNLHLMMDSHEIASERLRGLSQMLRQIYTINGFTDKFIPGFLQNAGEVIMSNRIARANAGDAEMGNWLKYYDPDYERGKQYGPNEIEQMASRFANTIHGSKDPRTLPSYMLHDNEISAFLKLAHWQISSTNSWMRNVYTPATKGNMTPLLMSSLGAMLGGAVIKKMREEVSNRKTPVPTLAELEASDANAKEGLLGRRLEDNKRLLAYNLMELGSIAGFGGIITSTLKSGLDIAAKNSPSGMGTIFPLDEVVSSTMETASHIAAALVNGDSNWFHVMSRGLTDWISTNVQLARVGMSALERSGQMPEEYQNRREYSRKLQDLRRFKMAAGLPYVDQSESGLTENPYMNLEAAQYKREPDIQQAMNELPPIIHNLVGQYSARPTVLLQKLESLKKGQYETMPSMEDDPLGLMSYEHSLQLSQGQQAATDRLIDYLRQHTVNTIKSSMVP